LAKLPHPEAALASYSRAIELRSDLADAHFNRAILLLAHGDMAQGWDGYEWRWQLRLSLRTAASARLAAQPMWQGDQPANGKSILIWCEQGLGDTLQFARYSALLCELGARVILEVQQPLLELYRSMPGVWLLQAEGAPAPPFDYHCALLSLPRAFKTTLATIPAATRLRADAARVNVMEERLGPRTRPRIGLVWRGNPHHPNDDNRGVALGLLLASLPDGMQYVSLQREVLAADARLIAERNVLVLAEELNFNDTAAACECLDLIVSVDTSIAHLSASLGRNTWILLPFNADWRWLTERSDTPWYPTVSLYRQGPNREWLPVLAKMAADLKSSFTPGQLADPAGPVE
jgi:hypothetical protein